jgi:hypothetical protein
MMSNKPPLFFVIGMILMAAYINYVFYQVWFEPKIMLKSARKQIYKLPRWYPFRWFYTAMVNDDRDWITNNKIMTTLGEIIVMGMLIVVLIAWFNGK